jgi:hypothetical protein
LALQKRGKLVPVFAEQPQTGARSNFFVLKMEMGFGGFTVG